MVNKVITCLFVLTALSFSQEDQKISEKKDELSSLRTEIKQLEKEIAQKSRTEKKTFEALQNFKKQAYILNRLINNLKKEEEEKEKEVNKSSSEIKRLEGKILLLKQNYAKSITGLYKYGKPSDIDLIINADNINQALLRMKYLQRFSAKRKTDLDILNIDLENLAVLKFRLEKERKEKERLAEEKLSEESRLKVKMKENNSLISALKKDKKELKKEIDSRRKAERQIKTMIDKLIAEAERKRKAERERLAELEKNKNPGTEVPAGKHTDFDLSTAGLSSFAAMKGRLNWPVLSGSITGKFGENRHQALNTVTLNYGVDIKAGKDLNVKTVADGIVSAIEWIPGYGSVIIITHSEDYRTVYSRLSEIYVSEGEKVKAGKLIAKVAQSLEGNILHFEIWNSRNNQNPEIWLARK